MVSWKLCGAQAWYNPIRSKVIKGVLDMKCRSLTRREFLAIVGAGSAAMAVGDGLGPVFAADKKPNIIVILADDQGYAELGCQGVLRQAQDGAVPTPNIDSIAKNGVRFTSGYVSCPVCSPTRAGLMTGRYQQRFGHEFNPSPPDPENRFGLPLTETTIANRLRSAGYATGLVGKWHLGDKENHFPTDRGFDEFFGFLGGAHGYMTDSGESLRGIMRGKREVDEKEYLTDAFAREAKAFIDKHKSEPFFLYLAFNAVHNPLQAPEKYMSRFAKVEPEKRRKFSAMLSAMDDAVGGVLDTLRKNGLEENTLIFYLSDNGGPTPQTTSRNDPLRGFKGQVWEGGIRVPFMVQWKGRVPAGKVYDKPVISLDIAPTALAAAGGSAPDAKFDGVDIVPCITGRSGGAPHEALCWRYGSQSAIRKGDWKLVKTGEAHPELYDVAADIGEQKNLASEKPEKLKELGDQLAKWDSELAKPLWGGRNK